MTRDIAGVARTLWITVHGHLLRVRACAALVRPISMPSLSNSPWIRGAPQSELAMPISRISFHISSGTVGRPPRRLEFKHQPGNLRDAPAHHNSFETTDRDPANTKRSKTRNESLLGVLRRRTPICCRNVQISASSAARDRNRSTTVQPTNLKRFLITRHDRPILAQPPAR